ncbi:MAG: DUF4361 domain-containing protein [Proteiniphilum sp.]|nr:DUF4361 domain-containing protein [Proteiniphilum sp.]MDD4415820.1 DUF4361 domain-containing protein [Proteiniphilum sp.]
MKNSIKIIFAFIFGFVFTACNSYDFEQEQFRNEVNLLSNSEMVYDKQVATLKAEGDTVFLVAGLSGTNASGKPFNVALKEADSLFHAFNKSNFDIDESRFARWLPKECYTLPSMEMQIPAGKFQAKFPVLLKDLHMLSPDSIYLLDYKIDSLKTDTYNAKKKEVLLRIYMKNEFATTKTNTFYNYTSSYVTTLSPSGGVPKRPTSANQVFPLSPNSVRMLAGDENMGDYKTALTRINQMSIKVSIGEKMPQNPLARFVTIEPYKTIEVVQLPPIDMYNNTYLINIISTPDGRSTYYKEFRLHYKYRLQSSQPYKEVKAILRMEYNPRADLL